jgi:hypothetical protein
MSAPAQVVQLTCPNCRAPVRAQVFTLIDVGQTPQLKSYLLGGQLNLAACQSCGNVSMIAAPLIYHDPNKQLFFVHFPQQLNARPEEQERFIGDATSLVMRTLPPEAPKGYVLAPRRFLSLNSLVEAVLEADGITKEMLDAQRRRVELISALAEAFEGQDEAQLQSLVDQHRAELNDEFFGVLDAFTQSSAQAARDDTAQVLLGLRAKLVELTGYEGGELEEEDIPLDQIVERLANASDEELEQAITELRPAIDYSFYEALTALIDEAEQSGDTAEAERLTQRRQVILDTVERLDQEAQELFDAGAQTLQAVISAEDPAAALRERREQVNEAFLLVLEANKAAAERVGNTEMAAKLTEIQQLAIEVVQESLSPEERLINQLVQAETPQDASALLRQNLGMVTSAFVKRINEMADEMAKAGNQPISDRLRQVGREAGAMLF